MDKFSKIWGFGLLLLLFVNYNGVTVRFIYPKIFFLQAWVGIGLIFFSLQNYSENKLKLGPIAVTCVALLLYCFATLLYAPDVVVGLFGPFWRGTGLLFYSSALFAMILLIEYLKVPKEKFALGLIYVGFLLAIIVMVSFFFTFNIERSIYLVVGNRNPLAFWLGSTTILSFLYRNSFPKSFKPLVYFLCLICLIELVLLGSRSSLGGVVLSFMLIGIMSGRKYFKIALGSSGFIGLLLIAQYFIMKKSILEQLISRTKQFNRLGIWQGAWDSFLEHPIFGYGMHGLIQGYWENYTSTLDKGHSWNENAHSLFLNFAGELGLIGLGLFAALCFFVIKEIRNKATEHRAPWWGLFLFVMIYTMTQPFFVDTVLLVALILFLLSDRVVVSLSSQNIFWRTSKVVLGVVFLVVTYFQYHQIGLLNNTRAEMSKHGNYRKVWKELAAESSYIDKVGAFFELQGVLISSFAKVIPGESDMDKEIRSRSQRFIKEGLENLIEENTHRPRLLRSYALNLIQENQLDKALIYLNKILAGSDQVTEVYYYKAVIFAKQRKNREAKLMLLKVKELNPNYKGIDQQLDKLKKY